MFKKYNYLSTEKDLKKVHVFLQEKKPKYMSYDTETNGLNLYETCLIGFSFSLDSKSGFYVPLLTWVPDTKSTKTITIDKEKIEVFQNGHFIDHWTGKTYPEFVTPKEYKIPEFIIEYMRSWFSNTSLIMHNAPFDVNQTWANTGIDLSDRVFLDTSLLVHVINENTRNGLKDTAEEWKEELGINPHALSNQEQKELGTTIIRNGGLYNSRNKNVWRAEPETLAKYAIADTFLTFGVFEVGIKKFIADLGPEMLDWFFKDEVMPVCKEVVIPMKRKGVLVDVDLFSKMERETKIKLEELEDRIIVEINPLLTNFNIGKSFNEVVTNGKFVKKVIELEGLSYPTKFDKKTNTYKETLSKAELKKHYQQNPHWVWSWCLGETEIPYSLNQIKKIKQDIFVEATGGKRYSFNIGSSMHLRWLFCDQLQHDKSKLPQTDSATKDNPIPSMGAEVLEEFFLEKYPWVADLMLWKKLIKLYDSYICTALALNRDGYLYMDMKQNGTVSGRFACSGGFNLHTLPKAEEYDNCIKCDSTNITKHFQNELIFDVICQDCGHVDLENLASSGIKKAFIAPPGYKIVAADWASAEPRLFAFNSGDPKLKEIFTKDLDFYSKIYCDIHQEPYRNLKKSGSSEDKNNRNKYKGIALSIPYGSRGPQVASLMGLRRFFFDKKTGKHKESLDVEGGWEVVNQYLDAYPELRKYMKKCEHDSLTKGYVKTLIGRKRHFNYTKIVFEILNNFNIGVDEFLDCKKSLLENPNTECGLNEDALKYFSQETGIKYSDILKKGSWTYVRSLFKNELNNSKNFPIQGLASHITNRAMLEVVRDCKIHNVDAYLVLQVHDELIGYVKDEQSELGASIFKDKMEKNLYTTKVDIPMLAEPIIANNLRDAK